MKKMLKRADGSTSQRGLWDNIRANKGSGKQPTKEMLKQEKKIKSKKYFVGGPGDPPVTGTPAPAPKPAFKLDLSKVSFGDGSTAGRGAGSGLGGHDQCITGHCKDVVAAGSKGGGYDGPGGAQLSMKPKYADRIVHQTAEEKLAGLENQAKYKAEAEARMAKKKAERDARAAASAPPVVETNFKRVYAVDPNAQEKTGGKRKSSWLEKSKELKFGGKPKKYQTAGPTMSFKDALSQYSSGKMTAAQANAATGYANKPKKYTDAENIDNLKKVFTGSHTVDAQGNVVPKTKKTGGKKKMGGKNC